MGDGFLVIKSLGGGGGGGGGRGKGGVLTLVLPGRLLPGLGGYPYPYLVYA